MWFHDKLRGLHISFRQQAARPDEVFLCCLFCQDQRYRLGVNTRSGKGHCFNCGWKSRRAMEAIAHKLKFDPPADEVEARAAPVEKKREPVKLPLDFVKLVDVWPLNAMDHDPSYQMAKTYMRMRGLQLWQALHHHIGISMTGRYAYRVVFPVWDWDGGSRKELCGLVARDFTGQAEAKYLNTPGRRGLFGNAEHDRVILAEGVFDALALERAVADRKADEDWDVRALLGHTVTAGQLEAIAQQYKAVILWPDPDPVGIEGMVEVGQRLMWEYGMQHVAILDFQKFYAEREWTDAGDQEPEDLRELFQFIQVLTPVLAQKMKAAVAFWRK